MLQPASNYSVRVFLVDDQPIVGAAVKRMLDKEKDIRFLFCQDPLQAVKMAEQFAPTVILQDLVMPNINGMALVKIFREHPHLKDVPLIVLSTKEEANTKAEAFSAGANDYLVKLPDMVELIARIRYHSRGYISLLQRNAAYEALQESQDKLAEELSQAADYVVSLFPSPVSTETLKAEWRFVPSERLGGDSLGYHWIDDEHFAMYLIDVCGHGVGSALLSVAALNVIRSHTLPRTDFRRPEQVMNALNEAFQMEKHNGLFFTIWYGLYNPRKGSLIYASAGHPPALLFSPGQPCIELKTPGTIIGGLPNTAYQSQEVQVADNSSLYIFSDGVYEIIKPDESMWSLGEFKCYLEHNMAPDASDLDGVHRHVQDVHGGPVLDDDFSIMKIQLKRS